MQDTDYSAVLEKRKKTVKKAGIIFIIVLLFLTFFSKTINYLILPQVEYTTPVSGQLENVIDAAGVLEYLNTVKVRSYGSCTVSEIKVKTDAQVKKGDILAEIKAEDKSLEIEKKELEIAAKENELKALLDSSPLIDLSQYEKDAAGAQKLCKKLEEGLATAKSLYESGAASQKDVTDAEELLNNAREDYQAKLDTIDKKKEENVTLQSEYSRNLDEHRQELEIGRHELEKMKGGKFADGRIRSEADGIVKLMGIKNGDTTNDGQVMFEIATAGSRTVAVWKLNELQAEKVSTGDPVSVSLKYPESIDLTTKVESKEFIPAENAYRLTAIADNPDNALQYGQRADISISKRSASYDVILPNSSILELGGKNYIYLLKEQKTALGDKLYVQRVEVRIYESDELNSAIYPQADLQDSEAKVVTFSTKTLSDGLEVKIK